MISGMSFKREDRSLCQKITVKITMAFLLMFVMLLHLVSLVMLFIATLEKSWWMWDGEDRADLWHKCISDNTTGTMMCTSVSTNDWLQSVQALMVLSVILSSISFIVFICQLFTTSRKGLFYVSGLSQIFAGLATFTAVLIYTFQRKEILHDLREGHFGYCFILAWVCVPLLFCSGVLYVHLRKKTHTAA
ncbi:epithelial membrane protein 3 isoform X2 [Tachysurus fulvidraco]|uniref:epithelial membrane protein 3 isoform X2 n=2 Tax=Tachysurus fulvidraco TaxID=1234273 RepID=UPI001FEDCBC6|nr:epithelial membrane protein 3 isoform X2 [Tachysurus fulvidraco]